MLHGFMNEKTLKMDVRFAVEITAHVKGLISQVLNMLKTDIQSLY